MRFASTSDLREVDSCTVFFTHWPKIQLDTILEMAAAWKQVSAATLHVQEESIQRIPQLQIGLLKYNSLEGGPQFMIINSYNSTFLWSRVNNPYLKPNLVERQTIDVSKETKGQANSRRPQHFMGWPRHPVQFNFRLNPFPNNPVWARSSTHSYVQHIWEPCAYDSVVVPLARHVSAIALVPYLGTVMP